MTAHRFALTDKISFTSLKACRGTMHRAPTTRVMPHDGPIISGRFPLSRGTMHRAPTAKTSCLASRVMPHDGAITRGRFSLCKGTMHRAPTEDVPENAEALMLPMIFLPGNAAIKT